MIDSFLEPPILLTRLSLLLFFPSPNYFLNTGEEYLCKNRDFMTLLLFFLELCQSYLTELVLIEVGHWDWDRAQVLAQDSATRESLSANAFISLGWLSSLILRLRHILVMNSQRSITISVIIQTNSIMMTAPRVEMLMYPRIITVSTGISGKYCWMMWQRMKVVLKRTKMPWPMALQITQILILRTGVRISSTTQDMEVRIMTVRLKIGGNRGIRRGIEIWQQRNTKRISSEFFLSLLDPIQHSSVSISSFPLQENSMIGCPSVKKRQKISPPVPAKQFRMSPWEEKSRLERVTEEEKAMVVTTLQKVMDILEQSLQTNLVLMNSKILHSQLIWSNMRQSRYQKMQLMIRLTMLLKLSLMKQRSTPYSQYAGSPSTSMPKQQSQTFGISKGNRSMLCISMVALRKSMRFLGFSTSMKRQYEAIWKFQRIFTKYPVTEAKEKEVRMLPELSLIKLIWSLIVSYILFSSWLMQQSFPVCLVSESLLRQWEGVLFWNVMVNQLLLEDLVQKSLMRYELLGNYQVQEEKLGEELKRVMLVYFCLTRVMSPQKVMQMQMLLSMFLGTYNQTLNPKTMRSSQLMHSPLINQQFGWQLVQWERSVHSLQFVVGLEHWQHLPESQKDVESQDTQEFPTGSWREAGSQDRHWEISQLVQFW